MKQKHLSITKISRPTIGDVYPRKRLFRMLDQRRSPFTWISGPAGAGKTTLISSYVATANIPFIWYQLDAGDSDIATFFYYMGLAARKAAPGSRKPLPLLTPEYLSDISTFSRRFFENLCRRLGRPFLVVFDNYQEVPADSSFHAHLRAGLSSLPDGVRAVIISRTEPPMAYAGMQAGNAIASIGWDELRLNAEEARGLVLLHNKEIRRRETIEWMHEKTAGWAAGLILLTKAAKREAVDPRTSGIVAPENIFDFFANELFDRTDPAIQAFLLKTAFLPKMTPHIAEKLTGNKDAGQILSGLNRRNYFTEKRFDRELSYQYHPLFREFLIRRANNAFSPTALTGLYLSAAKLAEEAGQVEDAAELYIKAGEWRGLAALALKHAQTLVAQGRSKTLDEWLSRIPRDMAEQAPWLLYWLGVCRFHFSFTESRLYFERAFRKFDAVREKIGVLLAWSGVVDTIIYEFGDFTQLGKWIDRFSRFIGKHAPFPSLEVEYRTVTSMVAALMFSGRGKRDIGAWAERASRLMYQCPDRNMRIRSGVYLALYYVWLGDLERLERLVHDQKRWGRASEITPLSRVVECFTESNYQWIAAFPDFGVGAASTGLEAGAVNGIHNFDAHLIAMELQAELNRDGLAKAGELLSILESACSGSSTQYMIRYPHHLLPWYLLLKGDFTAAHRQSVGSLKMLDQIGNIAFHRAFINITAAHALMELGRHAEARRHTAEVRGIARELNSPIMKFTCLLLEAQYLLDGAKTIGKATQPYDSQRENRKNRAHRGEQRGHATLRAALILGRTRGYLNTFAWYAPAVTRLCIIALEQGIEVEYVRELIKRHNLNPSLPPFVKGGGGRIWMENWPWPVRVYTLGRFRIDVDDKPLNFPGKAQKKPLELLKALVSFGGRNVSQERILDALWPETEGDLAHKSLEMALQRLRRLLENDKTVRFQEGLLTIDDRLCWIDVWAFERTMESFDPGVRADKPGTQTARSPKPDLRTYEQAMALYNGHFLPADTRRPWSSVLRERLRSKFLRLVARTGELYETKREWKKAAECFEQGLEKDAVCEEFYQHLMLCHERLGHRAEAVRTYERCRAALRDGLGLEPSSRTNEMYASLLQKNRLSLLP